MKMNQYAPHGMTSFTLVTGLMLCAFPGTADTSNGEKPNVILIMTDDQGIGDFGFAGNPYVKTPQLDKLAGQSLNLTNFYVSPVCAPTRASLMTGKFSQRTGVYDTYNGGATMSSEEITLAEIMKQNGYQTAIFGKWHLGDNYPYRPEDQGFDHTLTHKAGGIGQPGDVFNFFAGDSSYFNPVLFKNGNPVQTNGYCSDVFTNGLIHFIENHSQQKPFFAYLSFNAPHTPLQLPDKYYNMYKDLQFEANKFKTFDEAVDKMTPADKEAARKVYGMVTNIDDNIGRLIHALKAEKIYKHTILIFLTDNGPQHNRYKRGLKERKGSVYQGGIRVPCFIHYPEKFKKKSEVDAPVAHIDLLPSILDLCGVKKPEHQIDGLSIFSSTEDNYKAFWNRPLFFEWGRGFLQKYRNIAVIEGHHKLVGNTGYQSGIDKFELYNLQNDPQEKINTGTKNTEIAESLKSKWDSWYEEIISEKNSNQNFPAYIGTPFENPVILNRNDARGTPVAWQQGNVLNHWDVRAINDGQYDITYHFIKPLENPGKVCLQLYPYNLEEHGITPGTIEWTFSGIQIKKGDYCLVPFFQTNKKEIIFPLYVSIRRTD